MPAWAAGFDCAGGVSEDNIPASHNAFVPITIHIPKPYETAKVVVSLAYDESIPRIGDHGHLEMIDLPEENRREYHLKKQGIRLWAKPLHQMRDKKDVSSGGDFVKSGAAIRWPELTERAGKSSEERTITLYAEYAREHQLGEMHQKPITLTVKQDSTASAPETKDSAFVRLLPVEVKYVNRDAPNHTWETESAIKDLPSGQPLYSQPPMHFGDNKVSAGDLVSWEIKFPEEMAATTTFTWEAEGPQVLNPQKVAIFGGVGEKKWRIEDPLDWRPGKYKIRCKMDSAGGGQTTLELDQEIGVRSGEVMVVGWIDADAVDLPNGNTAPETVNGVGSNTIGDILNHPTRRGSFMTRVAFNNGFPYKMPLSPDVTRRYFNAFMIKNSGNEAPPSDFTKEIGANKLKIVDSQALVNFLSNARNYRLANRFQVKFLVDEQGKIKGEPFTAPRWARAGLTTVHLAPEKWFDFFKKGTFDNIPAEEGQFHKLINTTGQELMFNTNDVYSAKLADSIAQYAHARIADSGNASGGFVSKKINGRDVPWIWSEVKYKAPLVQGTVTITPNHEAFPAIWIYFNGQLIEELKDPIEGNDLENFIQLGGELNN